MLGLGKTEDKQKVVSHSQFGTITYSKRKGVRRLNLTVKSDCEINISMPYNASFADAEKFITEKQEWISKVQTKLSKIKHTFFDESTQFKIRSYTIKILKHKENNVRRILGDDGILRIFYPENMDVASPKLQVLFRQCVLDALYIEAKNYLPQRVEFLANQYGFKYNQLRIKNNSSNLGSCSYQNNINLNQHIMRLSDELIDYVILHELCHTVEKNHGKNFWKLMDSVTNNRAQELSKAAKKINPRVI